MNSRGFVWLRVCRVLSGLVLPPILILAIGFVGRLSAGSPDIVLYTSDVTRWQGNWTRASENTAAGGQTMSSADLGWASATSPLAAPQDYFEAALTADANTPYRVWARLRATGNSKWNDSVWVQFNDSNAQ